VHAAGGPWSGRWEHALCAAGTDHPAPDRRCRCGLYGWYHPSDAGAASGYGDVTAVIAARGRCILGDHGFRAASARIEAVALPPRLRARPREAARTRHMLAAHYPTATIYRSPRRMFRDHPPHRISQLGISTRPSTSRRYKRITRSVWMIGVAACGSVAFLPPDAVSAQRPAVGLTVLGGFPLWQDLLIWLVANSLRREAGVPGDARSLPREATPAVTPPP
jgi:hypothetical protein